MTLERTRILASVLIALTLTACGVNPVTGRVELNPQIPVLHVRRCGKLLR